MTKDAEKLISVLYKSYLKKSKNGMPKSQAKDCGSSAIIHQSLLPRWNLEDIDNTCRELHNNNLLKCLWVGGSAYHIWLLEPEISYMEDRFRNRLYKIADIISKFIPKLFR